MRRPSGPVDRAERHDHTDYLVVDDFGRDARAYRETDVEAADLETLIVDLPDGQY